jgi:hypothetical protein
MSEATLFIDNKYRRWYWQIIDRARSRSLREYTERHHVLPRSLGGTDGEVVRLTFREHFLAHWLLTKFTEGRARRKMNYALSCLRRKVAERGLHITSWQYKRLRAALVDALRGRRVSDATKQRMSETARKRSPEYRAKMSATKKGQFHSAETRAKLSAINKSISPEKRAEMNAARRKSSFRHSPETIELIRAKNTGKKRSAETKEKLRVSSTGNKWNVGKKRTPEQVERLRAGVKAAWANPDIRAKQVEAIRKAHESPELRAKRSAFVTEIWAKRRAEALARNQDLFEPSA